MKRYLPRFLNVTTSFAPLPGRIRGVCLPSILKSCRVVPVFLKLNVTLPGLPVDLAESLKENSFPRTWSAVALARPLDPVAAVANWTSASTVITRTTSASIDRVASCLIERPPLRSGARLLERVGDELELRLLVEAGRPRAD